MHAQFGVGQVAGMAQSSRWRRRESRGRTFFNQGNEAPMIIPDWALAYDYRDS